MRLEVVSLDELFNTRIPYLRWSPVTATNSSRILAFSLLEPLRYRPPIARTNSRRASPLNALSIVASSVTFYVRQQAGLGDKLGESMRPAVPIVADHREARAVANCCAVPTYHSCGACRCLRDSLRAI